MDEVETQGRDTDGTGVQRDLYETVLHHTGDLGSLGTSVHPRISPLRERNPTSGTGPPAHHR